MKKKQVAFRKKKRNKKGTILVIFGVLVLSVVVFARSMTLRNTNRELEAQILQLEENIAQEEARTEDLRIFETYTHTKKYAEEVATQVLGYVYEDEIVFQLEE